MKLCLLPLAFALASCAGPMTKPVRIAPEFTPSERETIERVALEWFEAIPETRTSIGGGGEYPTILRMSGGAPSLANGDVVLGASTRTRMKVWADAAGPLFENVVRHEFGHYIGAQQLASHPQAGQALKGRSPVANTCINAVDIETVCEGRGGCSEDTFPNCKKGAQ